MIFTETPLPGAYVIDLNKLDDERGWFARAFCKEAFEAHGLCTDFVQHNLSYNKKCGTIRGLHYQLPPHEEIKVVRCVKGAIFDVIVDIRESSLTYRQWYGTELSDENGRMLYVPAGFAHGFQTLSDDAAVFYLMSAYYQKGMDAGLPWNDPRMGINWPIKEGIILSERDKGV